MAQDKLNSLDPELTQKQCLAIIPESVQRVLKTSTYRPKIHTKNQINKTVIYCLVRIL